MSYSQAEFLNINQEQPAMFNGMIDAQEINDPTPLTDNDLEHARKVDQVQLINRIMRKHGTGSSVFRSALQGDVLPSTVKALEEPPNNYGMDFMPSSSSVGAFDQGVNDHTLAVGQDDAGAQVDYHVLGYDVQGLPEMSAAMDIDLDAFTIPSVEQDAGVEVDNGLDMSSVPGMLDNGLLTPPIEDGQTRNMTVAGQVNVQIPQSPPPSAGFEPVQPHLAAPVHLSAATPPHLPANEVTRSVVIDWVLEGLGQGPFKATPLQEKAKSEWAHYERVWFDKYFVVLSADAPKTKAPKKAAAKKVTKSAPKKPAAKKPRRA